MQYLCFANAASDIAAIGTFGPNAANSFLVCLDQDINLYSSQFGAAHFPYYINLTWNGARERNNGEEKDR